jgi:hypothetical protein
MLFKLTNKRYHIGEASHRRDTICDESRARMAKYAVVPRQ